MSFLGNKPWWKVKENGWLSKGVISLLDESKKYCLAGDIDTAIEILE